MNKLNECQPAQPQGVSRRRFLQVSAIATGGLLLELQLPLGAAHAQTGSAGFAPNAYIRIDPRGAISFIMPFVEMGQGTYTAIPMLIAEELEVDVDQVKIEHAPPDDRLYANPLLGMQITGGSTSVRASWEPLRRAGATARTLLLSAAAQSWGVELASCYADNGKVYHRSSGRSFGYGELADAAAGLPVPEQVSLKQPAEFKLVGTSHRRLDGAGKVDGSALFGIDKRLPGMQFAAISICPEFGGKLRSFDEGKAKAVAGVTQVVLLEDAVAVVAKHSWAAKQGIAAGSAQWDGGPNANLNTAEVAKQLETALREPGALALNRGDADAAMARAENKLEAVYEQPFLAHATLEPMNCTVQLSADRCDLWLGTQIPAITQRAVAQLLGFRPEQVQVHNHLLGGGFGRRLEPDVTLRAVSVARQVEGPLQLLYMREDDIQHSTYRPYYYDRIEAGLDAQGRPVAWRHRFAGSSIMARFFPAAVQNGIDPDAVEISAHPPYAFENIRVEWKAQEPPGIPTAFWRGVGVTRGCFVMESFIDELAAAAGQDPLSYRLALLQQNPRAAAVLQLAAEKAGWGTALPAGQGRGIALCTGWGSFIAQVIEVRVERGVVKLNRAVCAVDCGLTVNPDTVRAQMEGGIIFGLSTALFNEITLKSGRVEQSNFHDYRMLRLNESPAIEVHQITNGEAPGGVGEPGTSCVMPALTNAIYAATGKRVRKLPVGNQLV